MRCSYCTRYRYTVPQTCGFLVRFSYIIFRILVIWLFETITTRKKKEGNLIFDVSFFCYAGSVYKNSRILGSGINNPDQPCLSKEIFQTIKTGHKTKRFRISVAVHYVPYTAGIIIGRVVNPDWSIRIRIRIRIQQFSSIWIRIRIHKVIESGSNPDPESDPDPEQYFRRQIFSKI
jgi:hypothetical protein